MATTNAVPVTSNEIERPGSIFTWIVTVLACAYIAWLGASLYHSTRVFIDLYISIGVEFLLSTKLLISFYRFLYPIIFGGMAALVITKQFFVRDKWASVSVTLAATLAASLIGDAIVKALYHPLFNLMERLNK
jgi:hypothetical protein